VLNFTLALQQNLVRVVEQEVNSKNYISANCANSPQNLQIKITRLGKILLAIVF
jgi:hypothetical protein